MIDDRQRRIPEDLDVGITAPTPGMRDGKSITAPLSQLGRPCFT